VNRKSRVRLLIATGVIVAVFAGVATYLVVQQGAYYRQVADLAVGQYDDKNVKVGGRVLAGTIQRDEAGVHFEIVDLTGEPDTVEVVYDGQMPNAFAAGTDVVVTGRYASSSGTIIAVELQTKCPSKYEGKASPASQGQ